MAPDKIYVPSFKPIINGVFAACEVKQSKNDTEYIRKDALLEWAKGKMTVEEATEGIVGGYDLALKDVIKHIESL